MNESPSPLLYATSQRSGKTRILTSLVVIVPVFSLLALGGPFLKFMLLVPPVIIMLEWSLMALGKNQNESAAKSVSGLLVASVLSVALVVFLAVLGFYRESVAVLILGACGALVFARLKGKERNRQLWVWPVGMIYAALPYIAAAHLVARYDFGLYLLLAIMGAVWCGDIGAYYSGKRYGDGPLPIVGWISPKKSWQGLLGGLLAGSLGFIYFLIYTPLPLVLAVIAPLVSLVAHFGDLIESLIKRMFNRKDSGVLLPGHGGLMDRMDGFALLVPSMQIALLMGASDLVLGQIAA